MFSVVRVTGGLSLDQRFIRRPAATFFVVVEGDGMTERGIFSGDVLIVDRSLAPRAGSVVVAVVKGELVVRGYAGTFGADAVVWGVVAGVARDMVTGRDVA